MSDDSRDPSPTDIAFSPAVKAAQARKGSRRVYEGAEMQGRVTPDLAGYLGQVTSFYLATASAAGQPYIQHRGGPPGFLKVLDETTIACADFRGNRQYISTGNLGENAKVALFFMDYTQAQRIKLWGEARMVEDDPDLVARLMPEGYKARAEQALVITVRAWDVNCPSHIPQKFDAAHVARAIGERDARIAALEAELAALSGG